MERPDPATSPLERAGPSGDRFPERLDELGATPPAMQPVLSIRARVAEAAVCDFAAGALEDIRAYLREHDLAAEGPPFAIVHRRTEPGFVDVEAGWPTGARAAGSGRIHAGAIPRLAASRGNGARQRTAAAGPISRVD